MYHAITVIRGWRERSFGSLEEEEVKDRDYRKKLLMLTCTGEDSLLLLLKGVTDCQIFGGARIHTKNHVASLDRSHHHSLLHAPWASMKVKSQEEVEANETLLLKTVTQHINGPCIYLSR